MSLRQLDPTTPVPPPLDLVPIRFVRILVLRRVAIYRSVLFAVFAVLIAALFTPRRWTVRSAFSTQSERAIPSSLGGLAAQFGMALPVGNSSASPEFYVELLHSRPVLDTLLQSNVPSIAGSPTVRQVLTHGDSSDEAHAKALEELKAMIDGQVSSKTGIIHVAVRARTPGFALDIHKRLLELLDEFNIGTRQSQASAERRFTEERLKHASAELRGAENQLEKFVEANRRYSSSPRLTLIQERLQREVNLRQQIVTTLADAYEKARIEQVRDTPVLTVIEAPSLPLRPDPRHLWINVILAAVAGLVIGSAWALVREHVAATVSEDASSGPSIGSAIRQDVLEPKLTLRRILVGTGDAATGGRAPL